MNVLRNASSLVEEAELLLQHGYFARAYALGHLATEELGKLPMLAGATVGLELGDAPKWKRLYFRLRNHQSKISMLYVWERLLECPTRLSDIAVTREGTRKEMNRRKNQALYTHLDANEYLSPVDIVEESEARACIKRARNHLSSFEAIEFVCGNSAALECRAVDEEP